MVAGSATAWLHAPSQSVKITVSAEAELALVEQEPELLLTWRAWNMTHDTLLVWPRRVSTSQAFVSAAPCSNNASA
jgi:hypothetical protein